MKHLPINLNITGKRVTIVGGGAVGLRKCLTVLAAGAAVIVISPVVSQGIRRLAEAGTIQLHLREFRSGDLAGASLVYAATDNREVNRAVAAEALAAGILVEVTDTPDFGSFISPATFSRGDLLIAVSTGGNSPTMAALISRELAQHYGPEYAETVDLLGKIREKLLTQTGDSSYNKQILRELAEKLPALIAAAARNEIDNLLLQICGHGFSLANLETATEDSA